MSNLSRRDQAELSHALGEQVSFGEEKLADSQFGDPATVTAIIVLTQSALVILGAWLQKRSSRRSITLLAEHVAADGSSNKTELRIKSSESSAAPADVVAQLAKALNIDSSTLAS